MDFKNKNILIIGLAKTGLATLKFLHKQKANLIINDTKNETELSNLITELNTLDNIKFILGKNIEDINNIDLVVVSPGVPLDSPPLKSLKQANIKIIGDIELAYLIWKNSNKLPNLISITGTNGKTTTTSLIGQLFENAKLDTHIVGNIGNPIINTIEHTNNNSYIIAELSSFQLESIHNFNSNISVILNITPDHLNRHHTMNNYIEAKSNIIKNQTKQDITILNYDDTIVRDLNKKSNGKCYYFSTSYNLSELNLKGIYINENGYIVINIDKEIELMHKQDVSLPGIHNLQNSLATILAGYLSNIDIEIIKNTISTFKGVAHRQEFVRTINEITFINDSKATNPDSTIKALNSYQKPIILIAGGMDKKSNFKELADEICKNTKGLIVFGETATDIQKYVRLAGYEKIISKVKTLEDAVKLSYKLAQKDDIVLLSPACASWDMYNNYEERGNEFKELVHKI